MLRVVVPFLLAAALTGCATTEPGTATPGGQTSTGPATGTSTTKSAPVTRPKAVDMKTLDPCSLVTPEAKAALGIRTVQPGRPDPDYGEGSKGCGTSYEDRKFIWSIDTLVNGGADRLKETVGKVSELTELKVAGYPAYLTTGQSGLKTPECEIFIDSNDQQMLRVAAVVSMGESGTADGACERAKRLAEAAGTVLATK